MGLSNSESDDKPNCHGAAVSFSFGVELGELAEVDGAEVRFRLHLFEGADFPHGPDWDDIESGQLRQVVLGEALELLSAGRVPLPW